jgi:hypothetical protein
MRYSARLLSEEERASAHQESLKILRQFGVKLHSPRALELLETNGAKIDRDSGAARIPEEMLPEVGIGIAFQTTDSDTFRELVYYPEEDACEMALREAARDAGGPSFAAL